MSKDRRYKKDKPSKPRGEYRSKWHMVHDDPKAYKRQRDKKKELAQAVEEAADAVLEEEEIDIDMQDWIPYEER